MAAHTKIESNPTLAKLTSESLSEAEYRSILEGYYGFFSALENQFLKSDVHHLIPAFNDRLRTARLKADLLSLGLTESEITALPRCEALPSLNSESEFLGVLYVTEGSTLGGMLIAKHLRSLPFFKTEFASFLTDDPQAVSARWKSFIEFLESRSHQLDKAATLKAASETFQRLDRWMERPGIGDSVRPSAGV